MNVLSSKTPMKTILRISVLTFLLIAASNQCFALREIGIVSRNEAKEMGLEIRATAAGPDAAWLEFEFKTEGKLKAYNPQTSSRVEMEIRDGEKSLLSYVTLQEQHPKPGHVRVRFMVNRAYLDKLILTIVIGDGAAAGGAYEFRVKEFVELEKIR